MGKASGIQWTHHTFNPWWGCEKISAGCKNCYADAFAKRTGNAVWGADAPRRFFGDKHWSEPLAWNRAAEKAGERHRVFCASMADVFEDRADLVPHRDRLFRLIDFTPWLDWLLLTKRPENMVRLAPASWANAWPANVWAGTTTEDQANADARIPHLLRVPARVRFLSIEPMVGPVDLTDLVRQDGVGEHHFSALECDVAPEDDGDWNGATVSWVIVGGESSASARPVDLRAVASLVDQCEAAGVPVFVKQLGERWARESGTWGRDSHGGTPDLWPEGLRVREFPQPRPAQ